MRVKMEVPVKYTLEQRIFVLTRYYQLDRDWRMLEDEFEERFPNVRFPDRQTVRNMDRKFQTHGTVSDAPRSGRPRDARTLDNQYAVAQSVVEDPRLSTRRASLQLGLSRRTYQRILKDLGIHVYRPQLVQELSEDDYDRRLEFAEWFNGCADEDPRFYRQFLWSDEATFKLNGIVNRHNCVFWASDNPHITMEQALNLPGVMVWCGVSVYGIIGPYFFEGNATAQTYLDLLIELREVLNHDPRFAGRALQFQQDGAPIHYALIVREFLRDHFPNWIGRRGTVEWPPRSPDMTPCDFGLWGYVKDRVFGRNPRTLDHLKQFITEEVEALSADRGYLTRLLKHVGKRCTKVQEVGGGHIEHVL